jgi:hypothetical protein
MKTVNVVVRTDRGVGVRVLLRPGLEAVTVQKVRDGVEASVSVVISGGHDAARLLAPLVGEENHPVAAALTNLLGTYEDALEVGVALTELADKVDGKDLAGETMRAVLASMPPEGSC